MINSIFAQNTTILQIAIMIVSAAAAGVLISLVFSYKNAQSQSFAVTLALLPMVSALIIFMVNDHLGVSVAVAGAFTLVRFRSVAGSGRELIAIFSAMMLGLVLGMGYIGIAFAALAAIAIMVFVLSATDFGRTGTKLVKIRVPENLEYDGIFDDVLSKYGSDYKLMTVATKNMGTLYELSFRVTFKDKKITKEFIDEIRARNGNLPVSVGEFAREECI